MAAVEIPPDRASYGANAMLAEKTLGQTDSLINPWYDAFSVKPGETLYLDPRDRVRIW